MRSFLTQLVVALLLLVGAAVLWSLGRRETDLVAAQESLVTLRYEQASEQLASLPASARGVASAFAEATARSRRSSPLTGVRAEADRTRATVAYWLGDYTTVTPDQDPFLAANAAYRLAVREGGDWRAVVGRLDGVIKQYAEVLKSNPAHEDAAFNYEFAVRYRTALAARQQPVPAADLADAAPTPHGYEGAPPRGTDAKQFKMIVPMRPEERREADEAGQTGRRVRKG